MHVEHYTKRNYVHFVLGVLLISLGVSLQILSSLGAGSWDTLNVTLVQVAGYTVGTWVNIVSVFLIIISYIITRKIHFVSFVTGLLIGFSIDGWLLLVFNQFAPTTLVAQIITFFLGLTALALGITFNIRSTMPPSPIELVPISMMQEWKHDYGFYKTILEFTVVSIVVVLNLLNGLGLGSIGFGTLLTSALLGTYVTLFNKLVNKFNL